MTDAPRPFGQDEDDQLIRLWFDGVGHREIAERMGRSPGSVSMRANRLGLPGRERDRSTGRLRKRLPPAVRRDQPEDPAPQGKFRDCLRCGNRFWSEHF